MTDSCSTSRSRKDRGTLFGPLGFLYVAAYCLLAIAMDWKGWWPAFLGCVVMASWPAVWAVGGMLPELLRQCDRRRAHRS